MYLEKLQQRFNTQQQEESLQLKLKKQDLLNAQKRYDRLVDVYLDNAIDKETYDRKKEKLTREISRLENQINNFNNNSEEVYISMKCLLEVASILNELYASSEIDRKRKILKTVFPNFWLDGRKLLCEMKKPFEELLKGAYRLLNWAGVDSNHRTLA